MAIDDNAVTKFSPEISLIHGGHRNVVVLSPSGPGFNTEIETSGIIGLMKMDPIRCTVFLIIPILAGAVRLEGEIEVTKPPQRQEFIWRKSSQDQVRWPSREGVPHYESRFRPGERPTVAPRPHSILPPTVPPLHQIPSSRDTVRPPTVAPLPPIYGAYAPISQPGTPIRTVAPLPPHMKPDPYDFPTTPTMSTTLKVQPIQDVFDQAVLQKPQTVYTKVNIPKESETRTNPQSIIPSSSHNGPETMKGISQPQVHYSSGTKAPDSAADCTSRAHSWGCELRSPKARLDEVGHEAKRPTHGNPREYILEQYRDGNRFPRRDMGPRISGGWSGIQDWCFLPTGQFPYPLDCRRFVNCWNGIGYVQPCAPGTLFNSETLECDFPSKVKGCQFSEMYVSQILDGDELRESESREEVQHRPGSDRTDVTSGSPVNSNEYEYGESKIDIRLSQGEPTDFEGRNPSKYDNNRAPIPLPTPTTMEPAIPHKETFRSGKSDKDKKGFKIKTACTQPNGIFPHPEFCDRFINCHEGRPHTMMCGPGTLFDPINRRCDHARNVKCLLQAEVLDVEESRHIAVTAIPPSPHKKDSKGMKNLKDREQQPLAWLQPPWIEEDEIEEGRTPWSGQSVRLKGGQWPWEGFVEVYNEGVWSPVCDEMGRWNLNEGSVVCRQLGYHRGADITWQGDWSGSSQVEKLHIGKVECKGQESSFASCKLEPLRNKDQCNLKRDAAGVRCIKEYRSLCGPWEIPYGGNCYSIAKGSGPQQLISRETASKECKKNGASLASITSQEENDFISDWLVLKHPEMYSVITGGVHQSTNSSTNPWVWDDSQIPMSYTNWWNGWRSNIEQVARETQSSNQCLVTSRIFPCVIGNISEVSSSQAKGLRMPTAVNKRSSNVKAKWFTTDYHFWSAQDCSMLSNGAICKRNPNEIGCVWNLGMDYIGLANVTRQGSTCIHWDESHFGHPHPDSRLQGHNLCRNYGGANGGGAAEGHPWCYIDSNGAWESCDIPPCRNKGAERSASGVAEINQCGNNEFYCSDEECIANRYVCDGIPDCTNGRDEVGCQGLLKEFRHKEGMKLEINNSEKLPYTIEKWVQIKAEDCAKYCLRKESNGCNSFTYHLGDKQCLLILQRNESSSSSLDLVKAHGWDFYELLPPTVNCRGMFHCKNGSCINSSKVCNGIDDCGDQSDEISCSLDTVEFSLRLVGSNASHEGRIEVRAFGRWGVVCDDLFGLADADVVCREAGYALGAAEVVLHSGFGSGVIKGSPLFLMDDLECAGNEKSLSECQFSGWGNHNCGPEEVAGVVCKIPGSVCQDDEFHCQSSKECIPLEYLCDNLKDCKDGSDEEAERCQSEVLVRLADGPTHLEGRVEVRYNGIWGTVCDDDFGVTDAQVICRTLGLGWGPKVQALKDAHYGPGRGPIWLDELHCSGDEDKIVDCPRFPWGKNNCGHKEDASVKCTAPGDTPITTGKSSTPQHSRAGYHTPKRQGPDFLPRGCGIQFNISSWLNAFGLPKNMNSIQPKVVGGEEFKLGPIPWQASLRVRSNPGKSVHWCGAVILSPLLALTAGHCIQDYSKEAYILRVGDFDAKISEGTEQEVTIEEIYLHEEFNQGPYLNNDIAVIKIKVPGIQFNEHVHAACLPSQEEATLAGEWNPDAGKCFISGWGSVGSGTGFSRTLRSAVVPLLSPTVCQATHVYGKQALGKGMGCAGSLKEGSSDSCQGDSGGPLICFEKGNEPVLYGITSWGQGCGRANKPGVYSRVSFFRNWINQKVQEAMSGM